MLDELPQVLANGLVLASTYALLATGLSLAYSALGLVNFVHGQMAVLGSFAALVAVKSLGMNFLVSIPLVFLVFIGLGFLLERTAIRFVSGFDREFQGMIFTLGLALVVQNTLTMIAGPDPRGVTGVGRGSVSIGSAHVAYDRIVVVVVAVVVLTALTLFLKLHKMGLALRALSMEREALAACGVRTPHVAALAYGLAFALAGVAGAALAPMQGAASIAGDEFLLQAFLVVIIGGLGSVGGAVAAALVLAMLQSFVATSYTSNTSVIASFVAVMVLLAFRPEGMARTRATRY
jgi:branched-chain amino acid transport system permease protein